MRLINYIKRKLMAFVDIFKDDNDIDEKNVVAKTLHEKFVSSIGSINKKAKGIDNKIIKNNAGNILLALL